MAGAAVQGPQVIKHFSSAKMTHLNILKIFSEKFVCWTNLTHLNILQICSEKLVGREAITGHGSVRLDVSLEGLVLFALNHGHGSVQHSPRSCGIIFTTLWPSSAVTNSFYVGYHFSQRKSLRKKDLRWKHGLVWEGFCAFFGFEHLRWNI